MTLLMVELVSATVTLWIVLLIRGHTFPAHVGRLALLGLFEPCLTYAAVNVGLVLTSASDASLLSGTETLFIVLIAVVVFRQRPSRGAWAAILLAMCGIAAVNGSVPSLSAGWGNILVLVGALSAAIYVTLASRIAPSIDSLTMTAYQFLAGTILSLPFALVQWSLAGEIIPANIPPVNWAIAIATGILGLGVAFLLYNYAVGHVSATTAGMSLSMIPIFGLLGAAVLLDETIDIGQIVGAILILAALTIFALSERQDLDTPVTTIVSTTQAPAQA